MKNSARIWKSSFRAKNVILVKNWWFYRMLRPKFNLNTKFPQIRIMARYKRHTTWLRQVASDDRCLELLWFWDDFCSGFQYSEGDRMSTTRSVKSKKSFIRCHACKNREYPKQMRYSTKVWVSSRVPHNGQPPRWLEKVMLLLHLTQPLILMAATATPLTLRRDRGAKNVTDFMYVDLFLLRWSITSPKWKFIALLNSEKKGGMLPPPPISQPCMTQTLR